MTRIKFDELIQHSTDVKLTKKEQGMVDSWEWRIKTGRKTLDDCYKKPSTSKLEAYQQLVAQKTEMKGVLDTVVGCSCHVFSYAYMIYRPDCHKFYLCYETACSGYRIQLPADFLFKTYSIPALKAGIEAVVKKSMKEEVEIDWE